jgi:hypothetical protein
MANNDNSTIVKMVFDRWNALLNNCDTKIKVLSNQQLQMEITPGKNRGIYILGHLIAVHDAMLPLLDLGTQQHPDLFEIFVNKPDKSVNIIPSAQELRTFWENQLGTLTPKMESIHVDEWFQRHNSVLPEEFEKEPHRNKLNILLTRTTHLSYHLGQLALLQ